jgi:membrane protease YdiL (CAAX protease family)
MAFKNALLFFLFIGLLLMFNVGFVQAGTLVSFFLYETILLVTLLLLISERRRFPWGAPSGLALGLATGAVLMTFLFTTFLASGWLRVEGLATPEVPLVLGMAILFQGMVASGEELAFRGYMLSHLREAGSDRFAIAATALLFAAIHLPAIAAGGVAPANAVVMFLTLTAGGALMGFMALRWGLLAAIGLHFAWNLLQYHVFSMARVLPHTSLLGLSYGGGPDILTGGLCAGGPCGPEAGLFGLAAFALPLALLLRSRAAPAAVPGG